MDNIEFFMTLPSNDRSFPEELQIANDYKVRFPQPINFDTDYQVALYEFFFNVGQRDNITTDASGVSSNNPTDVNDLFVYCDLIRSQIVGSEEQRLIKHINSNVSNVSQVFRGTDPLQWVDVISKHITVVNIKVTDQKGRDVPMNNTTIAVLAFKKKP